MRMCYFNTNYGRHAGFINMDQLQETFISSGIKMIVKPIEIAECEVRVHFAEVVSEPKGFINRRWKLKPGKEIKRFLVRDDIKIYGEGIVLIPPPIERKRCRFIFSTKKKEYKAMMDQGRYLQKELEEVTGTIWTCGVSERSKKITLISHLTKHEETKAQRKFKMRKA